MIPPPRYRRLGIGQAQELAQHFEKLVPARQGGLHEAEPSLRHAAIDEGHGDLALDFWCSDVAEAFGDVVVGTRGLSSTSQVS